MDCDRYHGDEHERRHLAVLLAVVWTAGACGKTGPGTGTTDGPVEQAATNRIEQLVDSLYTHLRLTRWSRRVSAERLREFDLVELVHVVGGDERAVVQLSPAPVDGRLEVLLQRTKGEYVATLIHAGTGTRLGARSTFESAGYLVGSHGVGSSDEEWERETVLSSGRKDGSAAGSNPNEDPRAYEKLVLRFDKLNPDDDR